ncbi:5-formyltetrahydrofolate cyclo-ligase [Amaricoccus solimangrovi]|uniref:5-formyltetrahydrofolate cyclo-ligase n=1 Tax=Amaricoccus solimangrovi TaxID=2589815 RepID=A0A501WPM5_9RHOB|nr:5-formyltetrahydrofolate cyclo-ligase [Amaricoccus solimangrovi]TPE50812.1 5-formyltetrahydrofolate cyclo-ligase [Amaricoccus solimangrovi]
MSDLERRKAKARSDGYAARARAHAAGFGAARQAAGHALRVLAGAPAARVVAGYLPIRTEIDPRPGMLALHGLGYTVCVPVIEAPAHPLLFRVWKPEVALVPGPFKVLIPAEGDWIEPDALLVPLIAFDDEGHRLGYGGGFYDRTLHALRAHRVVRAYGFAYEGQHVPEVPRGLTDAPLDAVVTETGARLPAAR